MGKWSSQASAFSAKVNNCNATLDEGISEIQGIYSELEFDPNKEDTLAFNTNLFTKKVEEAINATKEDNLNIISKVSVKAAKLDEEEEELARQKAAQEAANQESAQDADTDNNED